MQTILSRFWLPSMCILLFSGCFEKKESIDYAKLGEDATLAEFAFKDIARVIEDESQQHQEIGKTSGALQDTCAFIEFNTNGGNWPMTLTMDFGSGCTDISNITRKGKIIAIYSGPYRTPGSKITITVEDYYVNDHKVEGVQTITNDGRNASNHLEFSVSVTNGKIIKPDGGEILWTSERTNEWIEGENTTFWPGLQLSSICDDTYLVSGYGEGTSSDGHVIRIDITTPLKKEICCRWVQEGIISIKLNGDIIASIDYDRATCISPFADLTANGNTYVISVI